MAPLEIIKGPARDYYPLTPLQKHIYQLEAQKGIGPVNHLSLGFLLEGELHRDRLSLAVDQLVTRHEILRTALAAGDTEVYTKVYPQVRFPKNFRQIRQFAGKEIREILAEFSRPFDLFRPPLFRMILIKISDRKHLLFFDLHRLIGDSSAGAILMKDLIALYSEKGLSPLPLQYSDFAIWYQTRSQEKATNAQQDYWANIFSEDFPVMTLPTDRLRPFTKNFLAGVHQSQAGSELTCRLKDLEAETGSPLSLILLAAYYLLLSKYANQEDMLIGLIANGRRQASLQDGIGPFETLLPLRHRVRGNTSIKIFLAEIQESLSQAVSNQEFSAARLWDQPDEASPNVYSAIFRAVFRNETGEGDRCEIDGLQIVRYPLEQTHSLFDLSLTAQAQTQSIEFTFAYLKALFNEDTLRRMGGHYLNILREMTANTASTLAQIKMLSPAEERQIRVEFNDTAAPHPIDRTYPELFEEQVKRTPDQIAVVFKDQRLTYSELNEKANRLAHQLRQKGVRPDIIVGILVDRSLQMIIGPLAVMKAGGAYLPLDPTCPAVRIQYMLKDSAVSILLGEPEFKDRIIGFGGEWLDLTASPDQPEAPQNPAQVSTDPHLAYVMYTSGTTGKPKGVLIEHQSLVNLVFWHKSYFEITATDRCAVQALFSSGPFIRQTFSPLLAGATLYIIPPELRQSEVDLNRYLQANQISFADFPTHLGEAFLEQTAPSFLKTMALSGEKLKKYQPRPYSIIDQFGLTECTDVVTAFRVEKTYERIPIGKPIKNVSVYIFDSHLNLSPIGVFGELCVSGHSLARGYLNLPDLTAAKFVENPFCPGQKMYRTGDIARWLPDGNIEYLDRLDYQVKIRGHRIESAEIEHHLLKYPEISEAVVLVNEDPAGQKYLCAYIVGEKDLSVQKLKDYLKAKLPEYMIPEYFVPLAKIPLTATGKINRQLLQPPEASRQRQKRKKPMGQIPATPNLSAISGGSRQGPGLEKSPVSPTANQTGDLSDRILLLKKFPLMTTASEELLREIASQVRQYLFSEETDVVWEGDFNLDFYLIVQGTVELLKRSKEGWQGTIGVLKAGDFFGEESLWGNAPAPLTVRSILGETWLAAISGSALTNLLKSSGPLCLAFLQEMTRRVRKMEHLIINMG